MNCDSFFLTGEEVRKEPYLYRACGLENIYLLNGYTLEVCDGEEAVSIADLEGLHKEIGRHLVLHRKGLAPKEVRFLRNTMGLTQAELADRLGCNSQSVARWEKGECEMPGAAEKLLRALYLVSLLNDNELAMLRELLETRLTELDQVDELIPAQAQFEFCEHWTERLAA